MSSYKTTSSENWSKNQFSTRKLSNLTVRVYVYTLPVMCVSHDPITIANRLALSLSISLGSHLKLASAHLLRRCHQSPFGTLGQPPNGKWAVSTKTPCTSSPAFEEPSTQTSYSPNLYEAQTRSKTRILFLFEKTHTKIYPYHTQAISILMEICPIVDAARHLLGILGYF